MRPNLTKERIKRANRIWFLLKRLRHSRLPKVKIFEACVEVHCFLIATPESGTIRTLRAFRPGWTEHTGSYVTGAEGHL